MKERKDTLGNLIEVGDIIYSAALSSGSGEIGRVEKIFPSGRITIKTRQTKAVYAYQRGAAQIHRKGTRRKVDSDGRYVYETRQSSWGARSEPVWEEYEYLSDDYTVVDHEAYWRKGQAAEYHVLVLKKAGSVFIPAELSEALTVDFDLEKPE